MPLAVPGTRDEARCVRVLGRVGPPRRRVCHDRGPARPCLGLSASRGAQTGGGGPAPQSLRGAASYEAER